MTRSGPGRWWVAPLIVGILVWNLTPLGSGADLRLYREMARTALAGGNPWTNPYADFPPLKMALFVFLERFDLWLAFRVLGFALFTTLAMLVVERTAEDAATMLSGLLLVLSPVYVQNWLSPFEDKFVYPVLALAAMRIGLPGGPASPGAIAGVSAVFGLLAGYGWTGILLLPVLAVFAFRLRPRGSTLALVLGPFAAVVLLAPFFPEWLAALQGRAHRQTLPHPVHQSLFLLLAAIATRIGVPDLRTEAWPAFAVWIPILLAVGACARREWSRARGARAPGG